MQMLGHAAAGPVALALARPAYSLQGAINARTLQLLQPDKLIT